MNLADILNSIAGHIGSVQTEKEETKAVLGEQQNLRNEGVQALQQAASLKEEIAQHDLQQQMEMESRKRATAEAFSVDILDPENRIAMLAREQAAAQDEYLQRANLASQLMDTTISDNPLQYLLARPFVPRIQAQAGMAAERAKFIDASIMNLNQQAQSTVQTQKAITTELTEDEAAKRASLIKLEAEDAIRVAKINSNTAYLNDLKVLRSLDEDQLAHQTEAFKLYQHEKEFNIRMEEVRANREARRDAKQKEKLGLEYYLEKYNMGAELLGRSKMTDTATFAARLQLKDKNLLSVIELGEGVWVDPSNPANTVARISDSPGKSKLILDQMHGKLAPGAQRTSALLQNEASIAVDNLKKSGATKITPDAMAAQIDAQLKGFTKQDGKKAITVPGSLAAMLQNNEQDIGPSRNIYRAPSVEVMMQTAPALMKNVGWKEIVIPAANADGPQPSVNSMLKQAKLAIHEGKISPDAAANFISNYYGTALQVNNVNERYQIVGLPVATSYNVRVDSTSTGMFAGTSLKSLDASNPQQIAHYLVSEAAIIAKKRYLTESFNKFKSGSTRAQEQ